MLCVVGWCRVVSSNVVWGRVGIVGFGAVMCGEVKYCLVKSSQVG